MPIEELDQTRTGGRRREALLNGRRSADQNLFTMADVATLQNNRTAGARAQVAHRLGVSLDRLSAGSTKDLAQGILALLMRDVEIEVRKALAEAVANSKRLPADIAKQLAVDDIEVARPVLEQSLVLTDEALIEIVRANSMQYALAVAGRENVSEELSQTLVDQGHENVVVRLVGNLGAKLSERTMLQIVDDFADSKAINQRLVRRPSLPPRLIEEMVTAITSGLAWDLIGRTSMDRVEAEMIVGAVRKRASTAIREREKADHQCSIKLKEANEHGELQAQTLLEFLRKGDIASFEVGFGLMAQLPVNEVRRLVYDPDRRYLAGLCARAEIPTAHYITLRMALELAEATMTNEVNHRGYSSESIRYLQKQYEILCKDELEIDELVYGQ